VCATGPPGDFSRPYGTGSDNLSLPGVETPGYFRAPLGRFFPPEMGSRRNCPFGRGTAGSGCPYTNQLA